jgi:hypothetical protein
VFNVKNNVKNGPTTHLASAASPQVFVDTTDDDDEVPELEEAQASDDE